MGQQKVRKGSGTKEKSWGNMLNIKLIDGRSVKSLGRKRAP